MENENNKNSEAVETPNIANTNKAETEKQGETSTTNGATATPEKVEEKKSDGLPQGVRKRLWELNQKVKELTEKLKEKERVQTQSLPSGQENQDDNIDLLEDPKKWENKILTKLENNLVNKINEIKEIERINKERQEALDLLINNEYVLKDENAILELQDILSTPELQYMSQRYPKMASEYALKRWLELKGINKTRNDIVNTISSANNNINTTTSTVNNKFSDEYINEFIKNYDPFNKEHRQKKKLIDEYLAKKNK